MSTVFFSYWNILQRYKTRKITLDVIFIMTERDALIAEKYDFHCEMAQRFRIPLQNVFCDYKNMIEK